MMLGLLSKAALKNFKIVFPFQVVFSDDRPPLIFFLIKREKFNNIAPITLPHSDESVIDPQARK